jgi:hypothetical protein
MHGRFMAISVCAMAISLCLKERSKIEIKFIHIQWIFVALWVLEAQKLFFLYEFPQKI